MPALEPQRRVTELPSAQVTDPQVNNAGALHALPFVKNVDGNRTIREIAALVAQSPGSRYASAAEVEVSARKQFESMWRMDYVAMALK